MRTLDIATSTESILGQVVDSPYTRVPLWQNEADNIVGVLHTKDLLKAIQVCDGNLKVLNIAKVIRPPWFVPEVTTLREQLNAFREKRAHFCLVVDEYGSVMGLVTLEDILEEIVGDILDEYDVSLRNTLFRADGSILVSGETTIRDLNRRFGWNLPDEEATTIAGLALHLAKRIPDIGTSLEVDGFILDVRETQKHRIITVRIVPPLTSSNRDLA